MSHIKRIDTTLLEQMRIGAVEISLRKDLLGLTTEHFELLRSLQFLIESKVDEIVDNFYEKQTQVDEISILIGDADTLTRLRRAQRKYIVDLFSGQYESEYVNNRLRIGMVHKRIGVEPKLYLSAVKVLKDLIVTVLVDTIKDQHKLSSTLEALDRLIYFDTTLVFDTYIDSLVEEIESAKRKAEAYAQSLETKVAERTKQLEQLARLDPLTGVYNRRAMQDVLDRELSVNQRRKSHLSLVYFDVDDFKRINDREGHLRGDEILKFIGQVLLANVRDADVACRYGGDEFCVILLDCTAGNAKQFCEKLLEKFHQQYGKYSISMGIAEVGPGEGIDSDSLIKKADEKMYLAKAAKGSKVCL